MPYIKKELRALKDQVVDIMKLTKVEANGDLNYILYKYCKENIEPSYNNYKNFIGELQQCAVEIERRILGPYEDEAIRKNGDV